MPTPKTIEVYADTRGISTCTGPHCHQRILWATVVKSGKKMCFNDPEQVALQTRHEPGSRRLIEVLDFNDNHWSTCVDARQFR